MAIRTACPLAWGPMARARWAAYVPHQYPIEELEPGLEETAFYDPKNFTFPAGAYLAEVEIDPETGKVEVVGMWAADDFGNVVNPMIVEGQVHEWPARERVLHGLRNAAGL